MNFIYADFCILFDNEYGDLAMFECFIHYLKKVVLEFQASSQSN